MDELSKIIRVLKKIDESIPSEIILVLDGNIGQIRLNKQRFLRKSVILILNN